MPRHEHHQQTYLIKSTYPIYSHNLQTTDSYKYLGIHIRSTLNWNTHIIKTAQKANKMSAFLHRTTRTHILTQNQTPSLHNPSSSNLKICQVQLGPTYSLQHPNTRNSTPTLCHTHHAELQYCASVKTMLQYLDLHTLQTTLPIRQRHH